MVRFLGSRGSCILDAVRFKKTEPTVLGSVSRSSWVVFSYVFLWCYRVICCGFQWKWHLGRPGLLVPITYVKDWEITRWFFWHHWIYHFNDGLQTFAGKGLTSTVDIRVADRIPHGPRISPVSFALIVGPSEPKKSSWRIFNFHVFRYFQIRPMDPHGMSIQCLPAWTFWIQSTAIVLCCRLQREDPVLGGGFWSRSSPNSWQGLS